MNKTPVEQAIAYARRVWQKVGVRGEIVHLLCDEFENAQADLEYMRGSRGTIIEMYNATTRDLAAARAELAELKARMRPPWLVELAERLCTQDNAGTAHPVFTVQQRKRIMGLDPQWSDDHIAWLDEDWDEVSPEDSAPLEEAYQATYEEPKGYTRTSYTDVWEHVMSFFTDQAARDYIKRNRHHMNEPRVWVDSAYRNFEWQQVVTFLLECAKEER